jgi:hypothetical protein
VLAEGLLLATGSSWDSETRRSTGVGLAAYGLDVGRRFRLLEGKAVWVMQAFRGLAYVGVPDEPMRVVDLASGRVVGERRQHPLLLLGDSSVVG